MRNLQRKILLLIILILVLLFSKDFILNTIRDTGIDDAGWFKQRTEVPLKISSHDQNQNEVPDALDFVAGARSEVEKQTVYDGSYYASGAPPEGRGACTDVIWRAFRHGGYDLRAMVDEDIRQDADVYGAAGLQPDSAIDYRRVQNLQVFFQRHGQVLTTDIKENDPDNLVQWQPGDIVVFGKPLEHIAIISDHRRRDGVPLIIHNAGPCASEGDYLQSWPSPIIYHFRFQPAD